MAILFGFSFVLFLTVPSFSGYFYVQASKPSKTFGVVGPFRVVIKSIEECAPDLVGRKAFEVTNNTITQSETDPKLSGNLVSHEEFDDSISMLSEVSGWSGSRGWLPNTLRIRLGKLCSTLNNMFKTAMDLLQDHEENHQKFCPRGPSNYTVRDVPMAFPVHNYVFAYGRWKCVVHYFRNQEKVNCLEVFLNTMPL